MLTASQNLFQAQSNLAVARSNALLGATAIYRALGGGWQIRQDSEFVNAPTRDQMRARTNRGNLLAPEGEPQPAAPGLPGPEDLGPTGPAAGMVILISLRVTNMRTPIDSVAGKVRASC